MSIINEIMLKALLIMSCSLFVVGLLMCIYWCSKAITRNATLNEDEGRVLWTRGTVELRSPSYQPTFAREIPRERLENPPEQDITKDNNRKSP